MIVELNRGKAGTGWGGTEADYQIIKDERWIHPVQPRLLPSLTPFEA